MRTHLPLGSDGCSRLPSGAGVSVPTLLTTGELSAGEQPPIACKGSLALSPFALSHFKGAREHTVHLPPKSHPFRH